jgi:hypothetical protein
VPGIDSTIELGIAAFAVDRAGIRSCEVASAPRVRGASVIKPLLFWAGAGAAPFASDRAAWAALAEPAIRVSDNDATAVLWSAVTGAQLLATITERTGVAWHVDHDGEHPSLRVLVTAEELARAYATFASDDSHVAQQLRNWMRDVPAPQTFGSRRVATELFGITERAVGVKCGWFGVERVHGVVLVELRGRVLGTAVTTYRPTDSVTRAAYLAAAGSNAMIIAAHDAFAGRTVRAAVQGGLRAAAGL